MKNNTIDDMPLAEVLERAGFKPPTPYLVKQDPRGSEYGQFRAQIVPALRGGETFQVSKWMPGAVAPYWVTCFDSPESFHNWATDL